MNERLATAAALALPFVAALAPWLVGVAGAATAAAWLLATRPSRAAWRSSRPRKSARRGLLLNLTAGSAEEIAFRLWLLPLALVALRNRALACVAVGLAFAASHLAGGWSTPCFVTRALVPGFAFSAAALASARRSSCARTAPRTS